MGDDPGCSPMIDAHHRTLLHAGRIRMAFVDGRLQWLTVGNVEVVRRIYVALRDETWTTVPHVIHDLDADVRERSFALRYEATATSAAGSLAFTVEVAGRDGDAVEVAFRGEARTPLTTNRVGLCLHYPHELAGSPLRTWRADDPTERSGAFPDRVVPDPPLRGLGGIAVPVGERTWCRASFSGDVFEMEDQRNFGDASFKVYSTPSTDPIPRVLQPGHRVEQRIVVELVAGAGRSEGGAIPRRAQLYLGAATLDRSAIDAERPTASSRPTRFEPVVVDVTDDPIGSVPRLGTDISRACTATPGVDALQRSAVDRLGALGVAHARLEVDVHDPEGSRACRRAIDLTFAAGVALDLVLTSADASWPATVPAWIANHAGHLATISLSGPLDDPARFAARARAVRAECRAEGATVPIGLGTTGWFIALNRDDLPIDEADFFAYALTPQVHVFDDDALRENLHGIEPALATVRAWAKGRDVRVGPVTLRPRGNEAGATASAWPTARDPRLDHAFGAVWTLGAIARHASGGAAATTLFELEGPEAIGGPLREDAEPSLRDIGSVIRTLSDRSGDAVLASGSTSPLDAFALALRTERGGVGWLANPTDRVVAVDLRLPVPGSAGEGVLRLDPYEVRTFGWDAAV